MCLCGSSRLAKMKEIPSLQIEQVTITMKRTAVLIFVALVLLPGFKVLLIWLVEVLTVRQ